MAVDRDALLETLNNARAALLAERGSHGHWEGELSSSALSTATAVFAIHQAIEAMGDGVDPALARDSGRMIRQGLAWLALNQNADGGWGDTTLSFSNISTTCLCWAAFVADENWAAGAYDSTLRAAERWLIEKVGTLDPVKIAKAIVGRYGEDHTFSVPILTMCAMAGRLGLGSVAWDLVPALPFELAAFPQRLFKWLKLPVVSYALPALIAIGLVRHTLRPSSNRVARTVRSIVRNRTLKLLTRIQPTSGGFLEATPLTSFVVMSLSAAGLGGHPVVMRGLKFLFASIREDGSWPIDTNLATWVTTLAVNALAASPDFDTVLPEAERKPIREWLLGQQYRVEHPYTLANPGGWAWTDLSGGVPDADDTAGAILALRNLGVLDDSVQRAIADGVQWLLGVQNRDGGIPTFCKGWGKLPFDRSSNDLTAHAVRAMQRPEGPAFFTKSAAPVAAIARFLSESQLTSGAWPPLWFGNQLSTSEQNLLYGTTRVLHAFVALGDQQIGMAIRWLLGAQHADGGWGSEAGVPPSIEETALAVEALAELVQEQAVSSSETNAELNAAISRGVAWLIEHTQRGTSFPPSPIGFYFAKLWYWEKLYPLVWTVSALGRATKVLT